MTIQNPITLTAKSRRRLYLSAREQIAKNNPEILVDFDRLHNRKHHEYPFLHEFRLGYIVGRGKKQKEEINALSSKVSTAWVDSVLCASAEINALQDRVIQLVKESL